MLSLRLSDPVGASLEPHEWTTLTVLDSDDQPVVSLASSEGIELREDIGRAAIKVNIVSYTNHANIQSLTFHSGSTVPFTIDWEKYWVINI